MDCATHLIHACVEPGNGRFTQPRCSSVLIEEESLCMHRAETFSCLIVYQIKLPYYNEKVIILPCLIAKNLSGRQSIILMELQFSQLIKSARRNAVIAIDRKFMTRVTQLLQSLTQS